MTRFFGVPFERLQEIGRDNALRLAEIETCALAPLLDDATIAPDELEAFLLFRAGATLVAACDASSQGFGHVLQQLMAVERELRL